MPMPNSDLIVWAAMFARTNYGHSMPDGDRIRRYRISAKHGASLSAMVNMVCGDYIETDDHYDMFVEEAESWRHRLSKDELEDIFKKWPNKRAAWEASEVAA